MTGLVSVSHTFLPCAIFPLGFSLLWLIEIKYSRIPKQSKPVYKQSVYRGAIPLERCEVCMWACHGGRGRARARIFRKHRRATEHAHMPSPH